MAGGIAWFRWHHGSVIDPKFQLVAKRASARLGDVIAVWALILESASGNDERGTVGPLDFESIDLLLGAEDGTSSRIVEAMRQRALVDEAGRICAWDKRQPKREREDDCSSERVRAYRSRNATERHEAPCGATSDDETPCNATERHETPREEKSREEKIKPIQGLSSNQAQRAEAATPPEKRASRFALSQLPEDWAVFCTTERPDLDPQATFARFSDFWRAKAGKDGRKLDWTATWRNWCRSERAPPRSDAAASINRLMASIASDPRFQQKSP